MNRPVLDSVGNSVCWAGDANTTENRAVGADDRCADSEQATDVFFFVQGISSIPDLGQRLVEVLTVGDRLTRPFDESVFVNDFVYPLAGGTSRVSPSQLQSVQIHDLADAGVRLNGVLSTFTVEVVAATVLLNEILCPFAGLIR
jgi:hypothetical protein